MDPEACGCFCVSPVSFHYRQRSKLASNHNQSSICSSFALTNRQLCCSFQPFYQNAEWLPVCVSHYLSHILIHFTKEKADKTQSIYSREGPHIPQGIRPTELSLLSLLFVCLDSASLCDLPPPALYTRSGCVQYNLNQRSVQLVLYPPLFPRCGGRLLRHARGPWQPFGLFRRRESA